ncbi:hypothetical protein BTO20_21040 [Mycobacterium dioxanotrophicus]|uniref:TrbL/VirB6 plasmid conjugal transfer protein n=1 Tax=Mycobacterium dioxanotrophicus TaxID=482462 RepID=A0A1Y0C6F4_9MYCO|nr:hypothetical protein [Mycobacterium dioxanotrophicus]ART70692.1 hypothetical protein BTO20_21040 [Mycobacterium dioxanotrophicus]
MASFLDLFTATDSAGAGAARYRLHFLGSQYLHQDSWIFGMITSVVFELYKFLVVPANALLGLVLSSANWMTPLSEAYQRFCAPLFAFFPPWAIACAGLALVTFSVFRSRLASTAGSMFTTEVYNRIGAALAMVIAVIVLTNNPFAIIAKVFETANGFSTGLASAVTRSANDTTLSTGHALVDQSIRTPAIALNYGHEFTDSCKKLWSEAMASGQGLSVNTGCFVEGQNAAGPDTVITAIVMLVLPALPMFVFAVVASWKFVVHLTVSVACFVGAGWAAAGSVHKRRGFDTLSKAFAHAASHLIMAVITSMVAVALPATVSGLATQILGLTDNPEVQVYGLMVSLGIGFMVSSWVIIRVTANTGVLVRLLHANADITFQQMFGISPAAKFSTIPGKLKFGSDEWKKHRNAHDDEQKKKLAANPADTVQGSAAAEKATRGSKGATVESTISAEDAAAVEQLIEPAASLAAASASPVPPITVFGNNTHSGPDPKGQEQRRVNGHLDSDADVFGHYVSPAVLAPASSPDDDGDLAGRAALPAASGLVPPPLSAPGSVPAIEAAPFMSPASMLTDPARHARDPLPAPEPVPVAGNVYADPALDIAARAAGATLVVARGRPVVRRAKSWLRPFRSDREPVPAPALGVPDVSQGPALVPTVSAELSDTAKESGASSVAVNAQQQWNRGWLRRWRQREEPVTNPAPAPSATKSGSGSGSIRHPGSFCAPLPDFVAADALQVERELIGAVLAANGKRAVFTIDPTDTRIGIRLSSDPDERVVRISGDGFGDPT